MENTLILFLALSFTGTFIINFLQDSYNNVTQKKLQILFFFVSIFFWCFLFYRMTK